MQCYAKPYPRQVNGGSTAASGPRSTAPTESLDPNHNVVDAGRACGRRCLAARRRGRTAPAQRELSLPCSASRRPPTHATFSPRGLPAALCWVRACLVLSTQAGNGVWECEHAEGAGRGVGGKGALLRERLWLSFALQPLPTRAAICAPRGLPAVLCCASQVPNPYIHMHMHIVK